MEIVAGCLPFQPFSLSIAANERLPSFVRSLVLRSIGVPSFEESRTKPETRIYPPS
jgi:hypothetical protein